MWSSLEPILPSRFFSATISLLARGAPLVAAVHPDGAISRAHGGSRRRGTAFAKRAAAAADCSAATAGAGAGAGGGHLVDCGLAPLTRAPPADARTSATLQSRTISPPSISMTRSKLGTRWGWLT